MSKEHLSEHDEADFGLGPEVGEVEQFTIMDPRLRPLTRG